MKHHVSHLSLFLVSALFGCGVVIVGCGGSTKMTNNLAPTPSVSQPPGGSGGSNSGGGSSGSSAGPGSSAGSSGSGPSSGSSGPGASGSGAGPGAGTSASSISGTVVDSQTGEPVRGTVVVALEGSNSDYTIRATTMPDAAGHFRFDNVGPSPRGWGWVIAVAAKNSDGTWFAPTLLLPDNSLFGHGGGDTIEPGIDVGTITLTPSPAGTISGTIDSENAAGMPQDANVSMDSLRTFTFDRHFDVPFLSGPPQFATHAGDASCAGKNASCTSFTLAVATANVWYSLYSHNGNQFKSFGQPNDYSSLLTAHSTSTGAEDCNPSTQPGFWRFDSDPPPQGAASPILFQNCTP